MQSTLVDTSVWIDFIRNVDNRQTSVLVDLLAGETPVCTCPIIVQEILQGIANDADFVRIKNDLAIFDILLVEPLDGAIEAATIYRTLRKQGITIRKSNDCLIAHHALFYGAALLQKDRDFELIAKHYPLKLL
jgi:hypothetical protein